ncbi:MAG: hypothetical protein Q4E17_05610 [Synergistes sp.]|nr:hypothetical protein [Synergistes sp.]
MFKKIFIAAVVLALSVGSAFAFGAHCPCGGMKGPQDMPPHFKARSADHPMFKEMNEIREARHLTACELFKEKPDKAKAKKLFAKERSLVTEMLEKKFNERLADTNDTDAKIFWQHELRRALRRPTQNSQWLDLCCELAKSEPDKAKLSSAHDGAFKEYSDRMNERFEYMLKNPPKPFDRRHPQMMRPHRGMWQHQMPQKQDSSEQAK